jgi:hypothetical protein
MTMETTLSTLEKAMTRDELYDRLVEAARTWWAQEHPGAPYQATKALDAFTKTPRGQALYRRYARMTTHGRQGPLSIPAAPLPMTKSAADAGSLTDAERLEALRVTITKSATMAYPDATPDDAVARYFRSNPAVYATYRASLLRGDTRASAVPSTQETALTLLESLAQRYGGDMTRAVTERPDLFRLMTRREA